MDDRPRGQRELARGEIPADRALLLAVGDRALEQAKALFGDALAAVGIARFAGHEPEVLGVGEGEAHVRLAQDLDPLTR